MFILEFMGEVLMLETRSFTWMKNDAIVFEVQSLSFDRRMFVDDRCLGLLLEKKYDSFYFK